MGALLFHEKLANCLRDMGVRTVFGLVGDANLFIMNSFVKVGGEFVSVVHEATAVEAARGYSSTTHELGVASVTHGPALTNTLTPLADAAKARTPILLLAGDTPVEARDHLQNVAQRELVLASGAGFEQLRAPSTLLEDLATAIRRAHLERRPVVLNIPAEFQWADVDDKPIPQRWAGHQALRPSLEALDVAVGIIAEARRPIVLAGRGAISSTASASVAAFAKFIGAPLATTLRAKDLFRGEPFNIGVFGTLAHPLASEVISRADCVIAFGAGLNRYTTADGAYTRGKQLVHVDVDATALGRFVVPSAGVVGDVGSTADIFVEWLSEGGVKPAGYASVELADTLANQSKAEFVDLGTTESIDLRVALEGLDLNFPADRSVIYDVGRYCQAAFTMVHVPDPQYLVHTSSLGSIGLGMGTALGVAAAHRTRSALLLTGDGGFMLGGLAELHTAVRHHLDLTVAIFNDGAFGAEHIQLVSRDMDPSIAVFDRPDFAVVANALGAHGYTVRNNDQLEAALQSMKMESGPKVIDIRLDPNNIPGYVH